MYLTQLTAVDCGSHLGRRYFILSKPRGRRNNTTGLATSPTGEPRTGHPSDNLKPQKRKIHYGHIRILIVKKFEINLLLCSLPFKNGGLFVGIFCSYGELP